jgi:hypothetical protein
MSTIPALWRPRPDLLFSHLLRLSLPWLCLVAAATTAAAQTNDRTSPEEMRRMQERMKAATATNEHHEALSYFLGDWDIEIELMMPGAPSQKSRATARCEWVIEGRWIGEKLHGTLLGAPYESFVLRGFDSYARNHVVATVQSMDTSLLVARGLVVDPENKVTAMYGTLDEYTTGELGKPFKAVTRMVDANRYTLEVWDLGIGADGAKVFEYRYTRKKA